MSFKSNVNKCKFYTKNFKIFQKYADIYFVRKNFSRMRNFSHDLYVKSVGYIYFERSSLEMFFTGEVAKLNTIGIPFLFPSYNTVYGSIIKVFAYKFK